MSILNFLRVRTVLFELSADVVALIVQFGFEI